MRKGALATIGRPLCSISAGHTRFISWMAALCLVGLLPVLAYGAEKPTFVSIDGKIYGALADEVGPIGGGVGYTRIVTKGDFVATKPKRGTITTLHDARSYMLATGTAGSGGNIGSTPPRF